MSGFITLRVEIGLDAATLAALAEVIKRLDAGRVTAKEELLAPPITPHVFPQTDAALAAENLPAVEAVSAPAPLPPPASEPLLVTRKWPECWKEILRREYPLGTRLREIESLMQAATPDRLVPETERIRLYARRNLGLRHSMRARRSPGARDGAAATAPDPRGTEPEQEERLATDQKTVRAWAEVHGGFDSREPIKLSAVNSRRRAMGLPAFRVVAGVTGSAWMPMNQAVT